jgi:hypothetical protein
LAICLGLASFSGAALAQEQPISRGLSSGLDLSTQAPFRTWRTTTIGSYKGVNAYRDALDAAKIKIGDAADEILGRDAFPYAREETVVELAVVSAAELGVESESSLADFYNRARQLGLVLCPAEVAPQLRLDYRDQPRGETLIIAMEPLNTYSGEPTILSLVNWVAVSHSWAALGAQTSWCTHIFVSCSPFQNGSRRNERSRAHIAQDGSRRFIP